MGRPKTPWHVARIALLEISRGAYVREAAAAAGISVWTVEQLIVEHGRMTMRASKLREGELTLEDREEIRVGLDRNESNTEIADRIGKHRSSVWREIKRNGGHKARDANAARAASMAPMSHRVEESMERPGSRVGSPATTNGSTPISVSLTESDRKLSPPASSPSNTSDQSSAVGKVTSPPHVPLSICVRAVGGSSSNEENGRTSTASKVRSTSTVISTVRPRSSATARPSTTPKGEERTAMARAARTYSTDPSVEQHDPLVRSTRAHHVTTLPPSRQGRR